MMSFDWSLVEKKETEVENISLRASLDVFPRCLPGRYSQLFRLDVRETRRETFDTPSVLLAYPPTTNPR